MKQSGKKQFLVQKTMLRRPPTRIELKVEDIAEYDALQKEKGPEKIVAQDKKQISMDQRIGYNPGTTSMGYPQKRARSDDE